MSDGKCVYIKCIQSDKENEAEIQRYLTTEDKLRNPFNHCVPCLDYFRDDNDKTRYYLITPILLPFDAVPFETVDEVLDFMRQMLEVRRNRSIV